MRPNVKGSTDQFLSSAQIEILDPFWLADGDPWDEWETEDLFNDYEDTDEQEEYWEDE